MYFYISGVLELREKKGPCIPVTAGFWSDSRLWSQLESAGVRSAQKRAFRRRTRSPRRKSALPPALPRRRASDLCDCASVSEMVRFGPKARPEGRNRGCRHFRGSQTADATATNIALQPPPEAPPTPLRRVDSGADGGSHKRQRAPRSRLLGGHENAPGRLLGHPSNEPGQPRSGAARAAPRRTSAAPRNTEGRTRHTHLTGS